MESTTKSGRPRAPLDLGSLPGRSLLHDCHLPLAHGDHLLRRLLIGEKICVTKIKLISIFLTNVIFQLRLTVLFLELSLSHFVATFNSIRPVSTLLILANSPRVCDQVYLERLLEPEDSSSSSFQHPPQFRIRLQATKSPFSLSPTSSDSDDGGGFSLFKTISYIIRGQVLNR